MYDQVVEIWCVRTRYRLNCCQSIRQRAIMAGLEIFDGGCLMLGSAVGGSVDDGRIALFQR